MKERLEGERKEKAQKRPAHPPARNHLRNRHSFFAGKAFDVVLIVIILAGVATEISRAEPWLSDEVSMQSCPQCSSDGRRWDAKYCKDCGASRQFGAKR